MSSMRRAAVALALVVAGCGHTETVLSLKDVGCGSCGTQVVDVMEQQRGVQSARYELALAEVHIKHDESVAPKTLLEAMLDAGFDAVLGAGQGSYLPPSEFPEGVDVRWLTKTGQEVDLAAAVVPGKITVVDFGAVWCSPCREVDAAMSAILQEQPDVALRKIDVVDWESPVASQHLRRVSELPYVVVYGKDGRVVDRIAGLDLERLRAAIEGGRR